MSTDFIAGLSQSLLNNASESIFPTVGPKLGDTTSIPEINASLTWSVSAPPKFALAASGSGQTFLVSMPVDLTVTVTGQDPTSSTVGANASARATINGNGVVRLSVTDISFVTNDPFVLGVLNAKKSDIASKVDSLISAISIPLGPINGITFAGYALLIEGGNAYAAGGLSSPVAISQKQPPADGGFNLVLTEPLIQQVVANLWWSTVQKTYSASGAVVHLNSYSASVNNGNLTLTLNLSGEYSLGPADWDISISPVTATLQVVVDAQRNIRISGGNVSRPSVSITPSNFWAWMATLGGGVISAITLAILNDVVEGQIQETIQGQLTQSLLQIPDLSGNFEGITLKVSPQNLNITGVGNQILLTGTASVTAY
ncbi:hypothetical protein EXW72_04450 [Pseudomonas sp. BCA14]|uniref:hypothetical protein n=1 Tax=Pseudomonas TaxID=286 RepID=UPI000CD5C1E8|nr:MULTISPECIES: hypothetical protein [Pseudomonas]RBH56710.1 hypothetical protein C3F00_015510 [Pseudomonas sp. MWU13-2860]TFF14444.1 hypothetical protein EXW70_08035 [Pseudomonas sp. JMN1]TFF14872.1 hypothetical protein EXW71_01005 [Pseudomonas sp. BCA17]TFF31278.1 hypothetical protein EXW72_04450 [Pseudomonas sp. BCA14]TFF32232.1 hypothetical protein EXW73_00255 [Pseudomonas sp. BCA13]